MLEIEVELRDGAARVLLAGEADLTAKQQLSHALLAAVRRDGIEHIDVDLDRLTFLDSSGISALLVALREAKGLGRTLRVRNADGIVARVLTITGILGLLTGEAPAAPDSDRRG